MISIIKKIKSFFFPPSPFPSPLPLCRSIPDNPRYWCKCGSGLSGLYSHCDLCGRDVINDIRNGLFDSESD